MNFSFEFTPIQWTLFELSLLLVVIALVVFTTRVLAIRKALKRSSRDDEPGKYEPCAVIIYSNDDAGDLNELLPVVLGQDYPEPFDVVVVNDGYCPQVSEVVRMFQVAHPNLYMTTAPDGARNLSRKKLALTLAIKATTKPVVVLTTAGVVISSPLWLRRMMRHFSLEGADIVLGFAAADPYDDRAFGSRARSFDHVIESAVWIRSAARGTAWRGTEHNLAYRRSLFFENKGFSKQLNLRDGDDDIFISEIARRGTTVAELTPESFVEVPGANAPRAFRARNDRRRFTERFILRRPHLLGTLGFGSYFIAPLLALTAALLSPANVMAWVATLVVLTLWLIAGTIWQPVMQPLHGRRLMFSLPWLAFTRPIRRLLRWIRSKFHRAKRYTWE